MSLLYSETRNKFLKAFVTIIRCLTAGKGNIGYLRNNISDNPIHSLRRIDTRGLSG